MTAVGPVGDGQTVVAFALDTTSETVGPAWAVTTNGLIITFDVSSPEMIGSSVEITGLDMEDWLVGIDLRPATGELIGLSAGSILYEVDPLTGEASALGEMFDPALEADTLGFDFNPTVDRIRVDVSTTQNLRLNPETGGVGVNPDTDEPTIDGNLLFADGDVSAGVTPRVVGAAYTNSVEGAEETQFFVIDAETNALALQDPPNDGILNTINLLSVQIGDYASFDIAPSGQAFVTVPAWDNQGTPTT
ncbi:DUF4394 domain-containing protein [soil metagenome]